MMNRVKPIILTVAACALGVAAGSVALAGKDDAKGETTKEAEIDQGIEKIGEPINCLRLTDIRSSQVRDNSTIDFRTRGNKIYRNTLPHKCSRLGFEKAFSHRTSITKLCNVDIIRVLDNTGGRIRETNACGLGKFQQIRKIKDKKDS